MSIRAILIMVICANSLQLFAQTEDQIKRSMMLKEDTVIKNDQYQLHLQKVLRNPYQQNYSEEGRDYIKYGGYRLAELLKTIAREGDLRVEILGIPQNPSVALEVTWQEGELVQYLPAILNDLSKHFEFSISESKAQVQSTELFVENDAKLKKHIGKPLKPGVLNSATKRKGKTMLKSYSLENLVEWVETKDSNKILLAENEFTDMRFNFSFGDLSLSSIYKRLQEEYGIGHRERVIEISVLQVSR